jgi:predicted MFS family arabinose efflux permease
MATPTEHEDTRTGIDLVALRNPILLGVFAISTSASVWVSQITFVMTSHKVAGQVFPGSLDKAQVAILLVAYLAALSLGLGIWSQVLTRMRASVAAVIGASGAILAPVALLASNLSVLSAGVRHLLLGIYIAFLLVQTGLIPAILAFVNKPRDSTNPLALSSVFVVATAIGSIVGPLIGGSVTASYSFTGLCLASASLAGVALVSTLPGALRDKSNANPRSKLKR